MQGFELERKRVRNGFLLASFPGHSHRQYCMQIQGGGGGGGGGGGALGDQVTCDRQRVEGALPNVLIRTCFMLIQPWHCEQQAVLIICLVNAPTSNFGQTVDASLPPCVVYQMVLQIPQALPHHIYLHTASNQLIAVGMAWPIGRRL